MNNMLGYLRDYKRESVLAPLFKMLEATFDLFVPCLLYTSTFLRCLNRLEIPTSGSIKFEGVEVDDAHIDEMCIRDR